MSKKKYLSPTASLATCLDFAARVLFSTASVQEICTKPVLAPMVVEAHRYGQQATKHLETGAPADVRKLLKMLQSSSLSRDTPLARLDVADLTWDFEGTVADTLEMELEELADRAATNTTDTCVVFSALTPVSVGGQAVIWFPKQNRDDRRNEDDTRTVVKKHQVLLYVCPGRVKVVKNVGDLVKKLYDELPSLRESGALYNVWAVFKGDSPANNQQEHHASSTGLIESRNGLDNQFEAGRFGGGPKSASDAIASVLAKLETNTPPNSATLSTELKKTTSDEGGLDARGHLDGSMNNRVDDTVSDQSLDAVSLPQQEATIEQEASPPLSLRFLRYEEVTNLNQYLAGSIFSFGMDKKVPIVLQLPSNQHLLVGLEVNENYEDNDKTDVGDAENVESAVNCTGVNQIQGSWKRSAVISSSVPDFSIKSCIDDVDDVGQGFGVRLKQGLAWQSCDGKVLRRSVRPQPSVPATNESEKCSEVSESNNQDDKEDSAEDYRTGEVESIASINEVSRPSDLRASQLETTCSEQFPRSEDDNVSIFRFGYPQEDDNECQESDEKLPLEVATLAKSPIHSQNVDDFQTSEVGKSDIRQTHFEDDMSAVEPNDNFECPELPIQNDETVPPPKPTVNYKDKLGARVWWELAYTARKLERAAMIEQRQRIQHFRGDKQTTSSSDGSRKTFGVTPTGPQRLEPTDWSKQFRPEKQCEVSVPTDESADVGSKQYTSDVVVGCAPELKEKAADVGGVASPTTGCKPVATPTTLSLSLQGENKQKMEPPSEALSPLLIQKTPRSSNGEFSLDEETDSINQLAVISTSVKCLEVAQNLPVQEDRVLHCGTFEPSTRPPSETLPMPTTLRSFTDIYSLNKEAEAIKQPPVMISKTTESNVILNLPRQEEQELTHEGVSASSTLPASSPHVRVSLSKEIESSSNKLNENRTLISTAHSLHTRSSIGLKINDSITQDEDESVAQLMWGSTRTSYENDRTMGFHQIAGNETPQVSEATPSLPFTVRGRVPIRTHRDPSKVVVPLEADAHISASTSKASESTTILSNENDEPFGRIKPSNLPRDTPGIQTTPRIPTPTPVATFIPLRDDTPRSSSSPVASRQERLNELRQKKLRKLQQTRDLSLQQHKEKQHLQRPLSFASSVYSKKASNRQLMQNALEFTLLAGGSMEKERTLALQALAESACDNFIVLLKSAKELKFRALYENHVERDSAARIYSVLPSNSSRAPLKLTSSEMISQFFKYSSAKKQFLPVPTRSFTVKTDACALVDQLVFKGKAKSSAIARLL